jgi:hypothetical protein
VAAPTDAVYWAADVQFRDRLEAFVSRSGRPARLIVLAPPSSAEPPGDGAPAPQPEATCDAAPAVASAHAQPCAPGRWSSNGLPADAGQAARDFLAAVGAEPAPSSGAPVGSPTAAEPHDGAQQAPAEEAKTG